MRGWLTRQRERPRKRATGVVQGDHHIGQVFSEIAAVAEAFEGVDVEAGGDRAVGADRDLERFEDRRRPLCVIVPACAGGDLHERSADKLGHWPGSGS